MYRKYREGELPDVQIKYSELIRPLQALAQVLPTALLVSYQCLVWCPQHDSNIARILFASLYEAILEEGSRDSTLTSVQHALSSVMDTTRQFYPPFIGCLQVSHSIIDTPKIDLHFTGNMLPY